MMMHGPETDSEDELPGGWEERATLEGDVFYANHLTQSTQWRHPRTGRRKKVAGSLPFGWQRQIQPDGKIVYVDHVNQSTTFCDPRLAFAVEVPDEEADAEAGGAALYRKWSLSHFRQRFDGSSYAHHVLHGMDLTTRIALVTGADSGIGFETCFALAMQGCRVVMACRSPDKGQLALTRLRSRVQSARGHRVTLHLEVNVTLVKLDLSSVVSVRDCAVQLAEELPFLDVLVLNAGLLCPPSRLTADGLEAHFQVNYLSHFYLSHLLKDLVAKSTVRKIIWVSAESHRFISPTDFSPAGLTSFCRSVADSAPMYAYNASKLFCLMAALEADRRWNTPHLAIRSVAVHPGNMVWTGLCRHWWLFRLLFLVARPFSKCASQAASCTLFAALAPEMAQASGVYVNNCFPGRPSELASDPDKAAQLWDSSLQLLSDFLCDRGLKQLL